MYPDASSAIALTVLVPIVVWAISLLILYAIIRAAIVSGLRRARHEARVERGFGDDAAIAWVDQAGKDAIVRERRFQAERE